MNSILSASNERALIVPFVDCNIGPRECGCPDVVRDPGGGGGGARRRLLGKEAVLIGRLGR